MDSDAIGVILSADISESAKLNMLSQYFEARKKYQQPTDKGTFINIRGTMNNPNENLPVYQTPVKYTLE